MTNNSNSILNKVLVRLKRDTFIMLIAAFFVSFAFCFFNGVNAEPLKSKIKAETNTVIVNADYAKSRFEPYIKNIKERIKL